MEATTEARVPQKLSGKGQATRARILEHAAELINTKGVHATNNEQLRRAADISGSQLNHSFPIKDSLVLAVIEWQAERVLTFHRSERFTHFDSVDSLREWAGLYIAYERSYHEGCSLGSLPARSSRPTFPTELANAFEQWRDIFRDGLERMQRLGRISVEADPTGLAYPLLSAFQGGMLLAQVARDIASLKDAPRVAIDYVQTFAMPPAAGVLEDVTEAQRKQPGRLRKLDPNQSPRPGPLSRPANRSSKSQRTSASAAPPSPRRWSRGKPWWGRSACCRPCRSRAR
jgi:AcrR family transcriptional regulator